MFTKHSVQLLFLRLASLLQGWYLLLGQGGLGVLSLPRAWQRDRGSLQGYSQTQFTNFTGPSTASPNLADWQLKFSYISQPLDGTKLHGTHV